MRHLNLPQDFSFQLHLSSCSTQKEHKGNPPGIVDNQSQAHTGKLWSHSTLLPLSLWQCGYCINGKCFGEESTMISTGRWWLPWILSASGTGYSSERAQFCVGLDAQKVDGWVGNYCIKDGNIPCSCLSSAVWNKFLSRVSFFPRKDFRQLLWEWLIRCGYATEIVGSYMKNNFKKYFLLIATNIRTTVT